MDKENPLSSLPNSHIADQISSAGYTLEFFNPWPYTTIKGQLIQKCSYEKSVSSKIPTKIFLEFCPEIFCSILRASWKLFGVPGDLVSNIINKEGYWKPKKLPGSPQKATKNFRSEIQKYFRWYVFWMKLIFHKDILKLSDL